jgi:hypothetical protein
MQYLLEGEKYSRVKKENVEFFKEVNPHVTDFIFIIETTNESILCEKKSPSIRSIKRRRIFFSSK